MFVLLEDGISYVHSSRARPEDGGLPGAVLVVSCSEPAVLAAALDCPGECIFIEPDDEAGDERDDIIDAEVVVVLAGRVW